MTPWTSRFAVAWMLALAPVVLLVPAVMLAGLGPCTFSRPWVIVVAFLLFIVLELTALPCFVRAARSAGKVLSAMIGMGLAILLLLLSVALEYYTVVDYWADVKFGL